MQEICWNQTQKELFEKYFIYGSDNSLEQVHKKTKSIRYIWRKLYNILQENLEDFDEDSKILKVRYQSTQNRKVLIFKIFAHKYLVIDMDEEITMDRLEVEKLLDEEFFVFALGEDRKVNFNNVEFYFLEKEIVTKLMNVFYEHSRAILHGPNIKLNVSDGHNNSSLILKLDSGKVNLSFISQHGRVNHIFLDENLIPIGTSNPTNNIEELKIIANRIKTIPIPDSAVPQFIPKEEEPSMRKIYKND